jgi:hypothetical protein
MTLDRFHYFAYGSNISSDRLQKKERCPSAQFVCLAYLKDHTLCFPQHNQVGHLVAGFVESTGEKLWGAIYSIEENEREKLYDAEGFKEVRKDKRINSYTKTSNVELFDKSGIKIELETFTFKQNKESINRPNGRLHDREYLGHIITGYEVYKISELSKEKYEELKGVLLTLK